MAEDVGNWDSFWDIASPVQAARALREFYGERASEAATRCAVAAKNDGRDRDHQFWQAAIAELNGL
jgi:hypothetical protein